MSAGSPSGGDVSAHRELVRALMRPGGPLAADSPHATVRNSRWFRARTGFTGERSRLHDQLVTEHRAAAGDVVADRQAIVLAGPPGAGKSTVLRRELGGDLSHWLVVDADEFKHGLLRAALSDGSYRESIVPPALVELEAAGHRFAPLELATLVHEESAALAVRARDEAIADGLNVVVDTVLSGERSALDLGALLTASGYEVRVVDVETTYAISAARIEQRWREVTGEFLADEHATGLGGRWVPSEYTRGLFPADLAGRSVCEGVARALAQTCPAVVRYELHRVTDPAAAPSLELALARPRPGGPLVDAHAAEAVRLTEHRRVPPHRGAPEVER